MAAEMGKGVEDTDLAPPLLARPYVLPLHTVCAAPFREGPAFSLSALPILRTQNQGPIGAVAFWESS